MPCGSFTCVLHVFLVILRNVFIFVTDVLKQEHFGIAVLGEFTCEKDCSLEIYLRARRNTISNIQGPVFFYCMLYSNRVRFINYLHKRLPKSQSEGRKKKTPYVKILCLICMQKTPFYLILGHFRKILTL